MSNIKEATKPRIVSVFSGCGGLDLGFHLEGYETVWANDFSEWAVASFKRNFGDVIKYGDITKIDPFTDKTIPDCDLILGGFPCQDFSVIWKQPGLNGTRGGLYKNFLDFVNAKKPVAFVAENVKGLLTANKRKAIETIVSDFESIAPGYVVKPHLYNFADYGVPQFRERLLISVPALIIPPIGFIINVVCQMLRDFQRTHFFYLYIPRNPRRRQTFRLPIPPNRPAMPPSSLARQCFRIHPSSHTSREYRFHNL